MKERVTLIEKLEFDPKADQSVWAWPTTPTGDHTQAWYGGVCFFLLGSSLPTILSDVFMGKNIEQDDNHPPHFHTGAPLGGRRGK